MLWVVENSETSVCSGGVERNRLIGLQSATLIGIYSTAVEDGLWCAAMEGNVPCLDRTGGDSPHDPNR